MKEGLDHVGWEEESSREETESALHLGYKNLQLFWRETLVSLESAGIDKDFLLRTANFNRRYGLQYPSAFNAIFVDGDLFLAHALGQFSYSLMITEKEGYELSFVRPEVYSSPEGLKIPSPFLICRATNNLDCLKRIELQHNQRKSLIRSTFELSLESEQIVAIHQIARDETFFPRPNPRRTKSEPRQVFKLQLEDGVAYNFNYQNRRRWGKELYIAEWMADRRSFLPYYGFFLPSAIQNACSFLPVVSRISDDTRASQ